jgi:hypothetical protein
MNRKKNKENKYVIFKTNIKRKHIYENDHFSFMFMKKIHYIFGFFLFMNLS